MSRKGKAWAALGVFLFACLVVWAVRTVPQAPQKPQLEDGPKVMSYDNTTTVLGKVEDVEFKVSGKEILSPGWRQVYMRDMWNHLIVTCNM